MRRSASPQYKYFTSYLSLDIRWSRICSLLARLADSWWAMTSGQMNFGCAWEWENATWAQRVIDLRLQYRKREASAFGPPTRSDLRDHPEVG